MNARTTRPCVVALVVLVLAAAGCGRGGTRSDSGDSTGGPDPRAVGLADAPGFDLSSGTIRVALLSPLSGPVQVIGEPFLAGFRARFDGINA
ncbi:MAG TPA: hypothetical protein VM942_05300, partial [Acidimicrobiales bacterium]|nr:hypothetical protein [Acidimicrobiales bacterium]